MNTLSLIDVVNRDLDRWEENIIPKKKFAAYVPYYLPPSQVFGVPEPSKKIASDESYKILMFMAKLQRLKELINHRRTVTSFYTKLHQQEQQ